MSNEIVKPYNGTHSLLSCTGSSNETRDVLLVHSKVFETTDGMWICNDTHGSLFLSDDEPDMSNEFK